MKDEIMDDYKGSPIAMIIVVLFGVLAMIAAFTYGFVMLFDLIF